MMQGRSHKLIGGLMEVPAIDFDRMVYFSLEADLNRLYHG